MPPATARESGNNRIEPSLPGAVREALSTLWARGHGAWVVGGSLRDALIGRSSHDWDLATDALPEQILAAFPARSAYENAFGTVAVRADGRDLQITTLRSDHDYADFRRPHHVVFTDSIELDLGRRDFTINAMAWGAEAPGRGAAGPPGPAAPTEPRLLDPFDGQADLERRVIRAVGDPATRFREDALRMVRAVRFVATLGFEVEPETLAAITANAELVRHLSGERIATELQHLLSADRPSRGLALMASTGILDEVSPELSAQRGVPQAKLPGDDLWAHTLRAVDAAPADRPVVRLAALVHDIGKPATAADGHFYGHEIVGADLAGGLLDRLRLPKETTHRVVLLVRQHMFAYDDSWSDAAVRRFIRKVGRDALDDLFALREADSVGSGLPATFGGLDELRARVAGQLDADVAFDRTDLRIDGRDLMTELGVAPGPAMGRVLATLLDRVIEDPALNDRPTLLLLARGLVEEER